VSNENFTLNWKNIVFNGLISAFATLVISLILASFTLSNGRILITSSFYEEGMFVTVVNINNLHNRHILNDVEIFIDPSVVVENIIFDGNLTVYGQDSRLSITALPPNTSGAMIIFSDVSLHRGNIRVSATSNVNVDFTAHTSWFPLSFFILPAIYFAITFLTLMIIDFLQEKRLAKYALERKKQIEEVEAEQERVVGKLNECREEHENAMRKFKEEKEILDKKADASMAVSKETKNSLREMKIYYLSRMKDYQKELTFWKDTVRKTLYQSGSANKEIDILFEQITDSLKTYGTKSTADNNIEEINYLANRLKYDKEKME